MSANNQTLIIKHKDRYLVFDNVQAESWDDENVLNESDAISSHKDLFDAETSARILDADSMTEYGIVEERLWKDSAKVIIK